MLQSRKGPPPVKVPSVAFVHSGRLNSNFRFKTGNANMVSVSKLPLVWAVRWDRRNKRARHLRGPGASTSP
jgi:hypothetical protein